jgi:hypothetical protein
MLLLLRCLARSWKHKFTWIKAQQRLNISSLLTSPPKLMVYLPRRFPPVSRRLYNDIPLEVLLPFVYLYGEGAVGIVVLQG